MTEFKIEIDFNALNLNEAYNWLNQVRYQLHPARVALYEIKIITLEKDVVKKKILRVAESV